MPNLQLTFKLLRKKILSKVPKFSNQGVQMNSVGRFIVLVFNFSISLKLFKLDSWKKLNQTKSFFAFFISSACLSSIETGFSYVQTFFFIDTHYEILNVTNYDIVKIHGSTQESDKRLICKFSRANIKQKWKVSVTLIFKMGFP